MTIFTITFFRPIDKLSLMIIRMAVTAGFEFYCLQRAVGRMAFSAGHRSMLGDQRKTGFVMIKTIIFYPLPGAGGMTICT
jgi:hypothetical protein